MKGSPVSESLLSLEQVAFAYRIGSFRLESVSLQMEAGGFWGIIGPNGSGKSTLLKLAAGILPPSSGSVHLRGKRFSSLSRRQVARQLAYLPQSVMPTFDYNVREIVCLGRYPHLQGIGFLGPRDRDVVDCSMEQAQIEDLAQRRLSELSGGQRQRAYLAAALAQEPQLLLLDEPIAALDFDHQYRFFELLSHLTEKGLAVAAVLHDLNLAARYCRSFVLLDKGRLIATGDRNAVMNPDRLADVYNTPVDMLMSADRSCPVFVPRLG